jgi:hypothetical protein
VHDNGVLQSIALLPVEPLPIDVTILLDTSGSVAERSLAGFKSDIQDLAFALRPNDRIRLVVFGSNILAPIGVQPGGARLALDSIETGSGTSFYNALVAVLVSAAAITDRPHLIFAFTDGLDTSSFLDAQSVVTASAASAAPLYLALVDRAAPLSFVSPSTVSGSAIRPEPHLYSGGPDRKLLQEATEKTGGLLDQKSEDKSPFALFLRSLDEFRASYLLTYEPRGVASAGRHSISVLTRNRQLLVRARRGYGG